MTYRTAAPSCRHCDEPAFDACSHCLGSRCVAHAVQHGVRCADCEHLLHEQLATIRGWAWRLLGAAVALPLFPFIVGTVQSNWRSRMRVWGAFPTGLALFEAAWMTAIAAVALGSLFLLMRRRLVVRAFQVAL